MMKLKQQNKQFMHYQKLKKLFSASKDFLRLHPTATYSGFTNFTSDELDQLVTIIIDEIGSGKRGKRTKVSFKERLFLTLAYYSTYFTMDNLASITSLKIPTLQRIIKK